MTNKYIKTPYTKEQLRACVGRGHFESRINRNGTWVIDGQKAMDVSGRLFLDFIKTASNRKINRFRGMLKQNGCGFHDFNRPHRTEKNSRFNPMNNDDVFESLAKSGEVAALKRLITRTNIISGCREAALVKMANKHKRAIDAKPFKPSREERKPTPPPPSNLKPASKPVPKPKPAPKPKPKAAVKPKATADKKSVRATKSPSSDSYASGLGDQQPTDRLKKGNWPVADIKSPPNERDKMKGGKWETPVPKTNQLLDDASSVPSDPLQMREQTPEPPKGGIVGRFFKKLFGG